MQPFGKPKRQQEAQQPERGILRSAGRAALAIAGLLAAFAVVAFVLAMAAHSAWAFPLAVAFAYTVGVAIFVLSPGRGSKGYSPFGPVVRRALGPLLRLHAVYVVLVLVAFYSRAWVWAHAGPWWTTPNGARHTTNIGRAESLLAIVLVFTEGVRATFLLGDAESELQTDRPRRPTRS
jgi:hypothetical protein